MVSDGSEMQVSDREGLGEEGKIVEWGVRRVRV